MSDWKDILKADSTDWLLEEDDPSVRYFTLKDILDRPGDDPELQRTKNVIMESGIVPDILRKQQEPAYIQTFPRFYTDKYEGLVWQLIVLAEMGSDINPQIKEQCEYVLGKSQEIEEGGFAINTAAKKGGGRMTEVVPCLTGNMVWSLIHFGYLDDPRLQKAIGWLVRYLRFNDGIEEHPQLPPYDRLEVCWGKHACFMGVVKGLKGLSAVPREKRTKEMQDTINQAVEFLLIHHIYKCSHDLKKTSKPGWLKFSFPLMYQTDILEILEILTGLGITDSRMNDALNIVLSKQDDMGRWRNENTSITDKLLIPIGQKGEYSKWITLRALRVLKRSMA